MSRTLMFVHKVTWEFPSSGVITPNKIPLTTLITYLQQQQQQQQQQKKKKELHKQNFKPLGHYTCMQCGTSHLQTISYNSRKHTVTYHFSDLQGVYSDNHQIHTKCQLQYLHPPQISTSGKCHCVIIHQTTKATEYIG